jgi:hypothetical protein
MTRNQFVILAISAAILILFAVFIWPTRYMYTHMSLERGVSLLVRVDRFTGKAEWFDPNTVHGGWRGVSPTPSSTLPTFSFEPSSNMKTATTQNEKKKE